MPTKHPIQVTHSFTLQVCNLETIEQDTLRNLHQPAASVQAPPEFTSHRADADPSIV
jgi:hypothetical protein